MSRGPRERDSNDPLLPVVWSDAPIRERITIKNRSTMVLAYDGGTGTADGEPFEFSMGVGGSLEIAIRERRFFVDVADVIEAIVAHLGPAGSKS